MHCMATDGGGSAGARRHIHSTARTRSPHTEPHSRTDAALLGRARRHSQRPSRSSPTTGRRSHSFTRVPFALQGVKFDPDLPQTIRLEFAKSNTKVSKPKQQSPPAAAMPTFLHPAFTGRKSLESSTSNDDLWRYRPIRISPLSLPTNAQCPMDRPPTRGLRL